MTRAFTSEDIAQTGETGVRAAWARPPDIAMTDPATDRRGLSPVSDGPAPAGGVGFEDIHQYFRKQRG